MRKYAVYRIEAVAALTVCPWRKSARRADGTKSMWSDGMLEQEHEVEGSDEYREGDGGRVASDFSPSMQASLACEL